MKIAGQEFVHYQTLTDPLTVKKIKDLLSAHRIPFRVIESKPPMEVQLNDNLPNQYHYAIYLRLEDIKEAKVLQQMV